MIPVQVDRRRRGLVAGAALLPLAGLLPRRARAAEFNYRLATGQDPTHPVNRRAREAIDRIRAATDGRLDIRLFPANELGSDTDLMAQVRNGGIEFFNQASVVLSTIVPAAGIVNTGFAFADRDSVFRALDGNLGRYVRSQIEKVGLLAMSRPWENGFRQITTTARPIAAPDDLRGLKLRVPAAPMLATLFSALGASPTPINFNELHSALQSRLVEGQENPLAIIATTRLYEVQRYCALSNHVWDAYWILGNRRAVDRLPKDIQDVVFREFDRSATDERGDIAALGRSLRADLQGRGLQFVDIDNRAFKAALARTGFYREWRTKFGEEAWKLLEDSAGPMG